jgi:hypothetical protein
VEARRQEPFQRVTFARQKAGETTRIQAAIADLSANEADDRLNAQHQECGGARTTQPCLAAKRFRNRA